MIVRRPAAERGHATHGWLDSWHSFSFAGYRDPRHMGFGPLRVINEDRIEAGSGFDEHAHSDMEIVSYVLEGALAHRDSLGNSAVIRPGDVQRMSAGTGVRHAEYNAAEGQRTHFLQIWIVPSQTGIAPGYEQRRFEDADKRGRLRLVASADGADGSVTIHQDARLFAGLFDAGERATLALGEGRLGYVHLVRGDLVANGESLRDGDALKLDGEPGITLERGRDAEVLVFDLPR
ncbi:MAG TPA: pirin family protein [Candidatus Saccharimonadia bacterium]|nr:pirin family protein [Candidatus Saccharimonadia bacterium]